MSSSPPEASSRTPPPLPPPAADNSTYIELGDLEDEEDQLRPATSPAVEETYMQIDRVFAPDTPAPMHPPPTYRNQVNARAGTPLNPSSVRPLFSAKSKAPRPNSTPLVLRDPFESQESETDLYRATAQKPRPQSHQLVLRDPFEPQESRTDLFGPKVNLRDPFDVSPRESNTDKRNIVQFNSNFASPIVELREVPQAQPKAKQGRVMCMTLLSF